MFMALNVCPSEFIRLYRRALYGPQSRIAILALNIAKKATNDLKIKAIKILAKITSLLEFQHISYNHEGNGSFEKKFDVKGQIVGALLNYFNF